MKISRVKTADGSYSLYNEELDEQYHSRHGAIQEAQHVFIQYGFEAIPKQQFRIFEMGFGTGLNFLMTIASNNNQSIYYETIESYPLEERIWRSLDYCSAINRTDLQSIYESAHNAKWGQIVELTENVEFKKLNGEIESEEIGGQFDLVYFDAFAPRVQPHLWTKDVFEKLYHQMASGGILVTYSSKGDVRRSLVATGFEVEKLPGPPGKREMLRARKK